MYLWVTARLSFPYSLHPFRAHIVIIILTIWSINNSRTCKLNAQLYIYIFLVVLSEMMKYNHMYIKDCAYVCENSNYIDTLGFIIAGAQMYTICTCSMQLSLYFSFIKIHNSPTSLGTSSTISVSPLYSIFDKSHKIAFFLI